MRYDILTIVFQVDSPFHEKGNIAVPVEVCSVLDVRPGDDVGLSIETNKGKPLYNGVKTLGLQAMIPGLDFSNELQGGQKIKVTLSRLEEHSNTIL